MKMTDRTILMIEDSDEDYVAVRRIFEKSGYDFRLERAVNADQALAFLLSGSLAEDHRSSLPSLILLDLNLPGLDGRALLSQLKTDTRFKEIPVVILTTSNDPRDVLYCYRNGANGYQLKAVGFKRFFNSIKSMISYWFETATLPSAVN